jgi:hypothetical protein
VLLEAGGCELCEDELCDELWFGPLDELMSEGGGVAEFDPLHESEMCFRLETVSV